MSSDTGERPVLSARGLSKCYLSYRRPLDRLKQGILGKRGKTYYREFWALRGVDLELRKGSALGVIGRNGSGKSTLLQILAGTLPPTLGEAVIEGRVGALLELGSGFNPEFSGRENVRLQATLLGIAPGEVKERMPEVEEFAEIGQFLDEPVKTYSSGMFVRLAFAVQIVFAPEVLIVDEALAVGDTAFQIKCMTRMRRLLDEGMSVILASHDMEAVRSLCGDAIWLHAGEVRARGCPKETTSAYLRFLFEGEDARRADGAGDPAVAPAREVAAAADPGFDAGDLPPLETSAASGRWGTGKARITAMRLMAAGRGTGVSGVFSNGDQLRLDVEIRALEDLDGERLGAGFALRNRRGLDLITFTTYEAGHRLPFLRRGDRIRMSFELENILPRGEYCLVLNFEEVRGEERIYHDFVENAMIVHVTSPIRTFSAVAPRVAFEMHPIHAGREGDQED
ncbi:MAG: ABC transporter ATP-binding protein [Planctomycetota bacterium]